LTFFDRLLYEFEKLLLVVTIDRLISESSFQCVLQGRANLVGDHAIRLVRLLDGSVDEVTDVDHRQHTGDEKNQPGDGQNEFCLESHLLSVQDSISCLRSA